MNITDQIRLKINTGSTSATMSKVVKQGKIIGVVCYHNAPETETIRAAINDGGSIELIPLRNIKDYRSRECDYQQSFLPFDCDGGKLLNVDVFCNNPLDKNIEFDFIFIYDQSVVKSFCS